MTRGEKVKNLIAECERRFNVKWEDVIKPRTHQRRYDPAKRWISYHLYGAGLSFPRIGQLMNCHHSAAMHRVAMYQATHNCEKLTTLKLKAPPSEET